MLNISFTQVLYMPPVDITIAQQLASSSVTGGLGFFILSISSEVNVFIFCSLFELIIYKIIQKIKYNTFNY